MRIFAITFATSFSIRFTPFQRSVRRAVSVFVVSDRLDDGAGGTESRACDRNDEFCIHAVHPLSRCNRNVNSFLSP